VRAGRLKLFSGIGSPASSLHGLHRVEMLVAAQNREPMLDGERGDPGIVCGYRSPAAMQREANRRIGSVVSAVTSSTSNLARFDAVLP
jgi:hypothetical protein